MATPRAVDHCTPPGAQAALFHLPAAPGASLTYTAYDASGHPHARSAALGVVAAAAQALVALTGEAWIRASDGTTAGSDGPIWPHRDG